MVPRAGIEPARCYHRGIFVPTIALATVKRHLWSGLSLHRICFHKVRWVPSSLYTFPNFLGFARDCHHHYMLRFPRIWHHSHQLFPNWVLKFLSPLRLPISPPGLTEWSFKYLAIFVMTLSSSMNYRLPQRHLGILLRWALYISCLFLPSELSDGFSKTALFRLS